MRPRGPERAAAALVMPHRASRLPRHRTAGVIVHKADMAQPPVDTNADADRVQVELLRRAGTARRFAAARSLSASVISLARRAIREREPGLSETEVSLRFIELHYGADLAHRVREYLDRKGAMSIE